MGHTEPVGTIIVGGGQAGLATSYWLAQQAEPHLVLEQASAPGHVWQDDRWDSFTLVTPNWMLRLPGAPYQGDAPDAFLCRDEIVDHFADYVTRFRLPVRYGARVAAVERTEDGNRYRIQTATTCYEAANVVIATGLYQQHRMPAFSAQFPVSVAQLHAGAYRHPAALAPGAVLVVGSGQSGCQIAEELQQSGRQVYLCVGHAGRQPRRYRGQDSMAWRYLMGTIDRFANQLSSPRDRFEPHPHLSGKAGGHSLNLHQFARDGMTLLGHLRAVHDGRISLAPDLHQNLAIADKAEADFCDAVDRYIAQTGTEMPDETLPQLTDGYAREAPDELDLVAAGIHTVIWAIGYSFDFSLVRLPVCDATGYPLQAAGITRFPGLYFVGLPWLRTQASGLLYGVGNDAAWIAADIARHARQR